MPPKNKKSSKSPKSPKAAKSLSKTLKTISPIPGSPGGPGGIDNATATSIRTTSLLFAIVIGLIALVINVYAIIWIYKLESIDCKCSNSWMRLYIKYYLHVIIPVMSISLLINIYLYFNNMTYRDLTSGLFSFYRVFVGFVNFLGFLNIIISIIFINKLKEINCECSEDVKREVYFIYNIVLASIISLIILFALMSIPLVLSSKTN